MVFQKNKSEEKELWIISLDFGNGSESEEFVETSEENAVEKIKDLIKERKSMFEGEDDVWHTIIDNISVAEVRVMGIKYPTTITTIELK